LRGKGPDSFPSQERASAGLTGRARSAALEKIQTIWEKRPLGETPSIPKKKREKGKRVHLRGEKNGPRRVGKVLN